MDLRDAAGGHRCAGHGRIEERLCRVAYAGWLSERHPKGLHSLEAITERRIDKK